jgi:cell division initiation protein
MDGTPELVTNVRFDERKRGYDPEQVDNYLRQVSEKVAQLRSMAREAVERAEAAEAAAAEHRRAPSDPEQEATKAAGVLAMAQKTADATVAEARESAESQVSEAKRRADELVATATAEADEQRTTAKRELDRSRSEQLEQLRNEIAELESRRDAVKADVGRLDEFIDAERSRLGAVIEGIAATLEGDDGLTVADAPELATGGEGAPDAPDAQPSDPQPAGEATAGEAPPSSAASDAAGDESSVEPAAGLTVGGSGTGPESERHTAAEAVSSEAAHAPPEVSAPERSSKDAPADPEADPEATTAGGAPHALSSDPSAAGQEDEPPPASPPAADFWGDADEPPAAERGSAVMDMVRERAVASGRGDAARASAPTDAPDDEGPATEAVPVASLFEDDEPLPTSSDRGESSLGRPDEDDDAAMRAFFEGDLDESDERAKGWFRRH